MDRLRLTLGCLSSMGGLAACNAVFGIHQLSGPDDAGVVEAGPFAEVDAPAPAVDGTTPDAADSDAYTGRPSCEGGGPGQTSCGAGDDCCATLLVPGGHFYRTYAIDDAGIGDSGADLARVSDFRLDRYEVTVGRYRRFVFAWNAGNARPLAGSGKHVHLNGGNGLESATSPGTYEPGWLADDDGKLAPAANLRCDNAATWADAVTWQDSLPMTCVDWYAAYAFCIWDGGFLPSEAEWEYAAAGGDEQRKYPWGAVEPSGFDYAVMDCMYPTRSRSCVGLLNHAPVGTAQKGSGKWGHFDLAGSVFEWTIDRQAPYATSSDGAYLVQGPNTIFRGGSMYDDAAHVLPTLRSYAPPNSAMGNLGFRCARAP